MTDTITIPSSGLYKIGSTAIPDPSSVKASISPLQGEATGRTDDGIFHSEIISLGKRKLILQYDVLPKNQMNVLISLLMQQYFNFTYPDDMEESGSKTIECYGVPLEADLYSGVLYGGLWRNLKFSCIER